MRTLYFISLLLFILINGCKNQEPKTPGSTNTPKSSAKEISNPTVSIPNATSNFNASNNTYTYTVPAGTSLTAIAFNFTLPAEATSVPAPGSVQDFTNPVTYTITAADGSKSIMTVVFSVQSVPKSTEKKILNFTFNSLSPIVQATIDDENKKITARVPPAVDITKLAPTIIMSPKASISPNSGVVQNFTNPVNYIVTAEDGSIESYQVTISKEIISQSNDLLIISSSRKLFAIDAKIGNKIWEAQISNYIVGSPIIFEGKVLGAMYSSNVLEAFDVTTGKNNWVTSQSVGRATFRSPIIYKDKILINSSTDIFVIDPDNGKTDNPIKNLTNISSPIMLHNDKLYFGTLYSTLRNPAYCLDLKSSQILWKAETNDEASLVGNPVYHKNNVIFGNTSGSLFCFDADKGSLIWNTSGKVSDKSYSNYSSPTVEGDVVFSTNGRFISATNAINGERKWQFDTNMNIILEENSPILGEGLVFSAFSSQLFAINAEDGTKKWEQNLGSTFKTPPVYHDGVIYITSYDGYLNAINAKNGIPIWRFPDIFSNTYPIILDKTGKVHYSSMSGEKN